MKLLNQKYKFLFLFVSVFVFLYSAYFIFEKHKSVPITAIFGDKIWAKPIEYLPPLEGVGEVRASNCGKCHTEIYKEWSFSTHSHALSDLQFQAELQKETSPKWLCLNCHIPIENQRETLVVGLRGGDILKPIEVPNPNYDPDMEKEAITCANCHVRVDEKTKKSYIIGANGFSNAPHPIKKNLEFLKNRCLDCHNQTYQVNQTLVCSFQTGSEITSGESNSCANCHMPEIQRQIVKSELKTPIRKSHKHGFIGGGVPKEYSLYPHQVDLGYRPGIILSDITQEGDITKLSLKNMYGGHSVPSGDPERFYRMEWKGMDSSGKLIFNETKEFGQTWEWSPKAKKIADNRLVSGQNFVWEKKVPNTVVHFSFTAKHIRLKNSVSDYMSQTTNHKDPVVFSKIKNLKQYYPHSSTVLETKWTRGKKDRKDTELKELMNRNEKSFGE